MLYSPKRSTGYELSRCAIYQVCLTFRDFMQVKPFEFSEKDKKRDFGTLGRDS